MRLPRVALRVPLLLVLASCVTRRPPLAPPAPAPHLLPPMGYCVQVGAFANPDNAVRLSESLSGRGLEAFHFVGDDDLHRVRFGNFGTAEAAKRRADSLRREGILADYYIVPPDTYARGGPDLRDRVVGSALSLLGQPYRWGGDSTETGFDCSGLTLTAYRLNGLALPRTSVSQHAAGAPVRVSNLRKADLVFFATEGRGQPSHVGLFVGDGRFIHAPGRGKVVRIDALSQAYYRRHFLAARSYLR